MDAEPCPMCDATPHVLIAIRHRAMRDYTRDLLQHELRCWIATEAPGHDDLEQEIRLLDPDLVVVDAADFPRCCERGLQRDEPLRVIVIGPEPDPSHRALVLSDGARSWIPRERVAEELGVEMRRLLGCTHDPCPAAESHRRRSAAVRLRLGPGRVR